MKDTDRGLIWEAYVSETTHSPENSCLDDEYYCTKEKKCKKKEDKERKERPAGTLGDGPVNGEATGHYVEWLKKHSTEKGEWGPIGMEGVISHPFEETYAEYVNQAGLTDPYRAALAHMKVAETGDNEGYKFYHEVDLQSLEKWKYHGQDEVHGDSDEDDSKRDGPGYDPDGNPVDDSDDAEDNPEEGFEKEDGDDEEKPGPHADRAKKAGEDFGKSGGKMFVQHGDEDDDDDDDDDDSHGDNLVDIYKKTLEDEEKG